MRPEPDLIPDVAQDEVERFAVRLLVHQRIVDANVVQRLSQAIGQGTAHISRAANHQHLRQFGPPLLSYSASRPDLTRQIVRPLSGVPRGARSWPVLAERPPPAEARLEAGRPSRSHIRRGKFGRCPAALAVIAWDARPPPSVPRAMPEQSPSIGRVWRATWPLLPTSDARRGGSGG